MAVAFGILPFTTVKLKLKAVVATAIARVMAATASFQN
jgi:hypothetical protein